MVGESKVGKSSLILKMASNEFPQNYLMTIGADVKLLTFSHDKQRTSKVQLWDTAGVERFRTIVRSFYRGSNGMIFVFDITNRESFESLNKWYENAQAFLHKGNQKLLIGNKVDLASTDRQVTQEEARVFAEDREMTYVEVSARNDNREELLIEIKNMVEKLIADLKGEVYENEDNEIVKLQKFKFKQVWRCF